MLLGIKHFYKIISVQGEKRLFGDESGSSEISKKIKISHGDEAGTSSGFVVMCTKAQFKRLKELSEKFECETRECMKDGIDPNQEQVEIKRVSYEDQEDFRFFIQNLSL